jgi:regulator of protease activity HflC (stomatin/prohibitin superfamily)
MKTIKWIFISSALVFLVSSCAIVRQGEVGVKRKLGQLRPIAYDPGPVGYNPFTTVVLKVPVRTVNIEIRSNLPSKEGLPVQSVISILYHIQPKSAPEILEKIGEDYEEVVIKSVFRSAAADVCSQFFAKDMHTSKRAEIELKIQQRMSELLGPRGFEIEAVLMKTIQLPAGLARAVELKLEAEQDAQRMEFLLQRERLEAERRKVEAEGIRDAQQILQQGISEEIIKWQSIEAFKQLSESTNSKIIITDGKAPFLLPTDN